MRSSVGARECLQTGDLARVTTENCLLDRVDVGALARRQVESGEDALSVLQDIDAEGGLALALTGGGCVGRWRRFWERSEGLVEVGVGCLGRMALSGGDVLADNARHVAGDAACAMGLLVGIPVFHTFGKDGWLTIRLGLGGCGLRQCAIGDLRRCPHG